ncbi:MAG: energy-coupling factor ABC transporter ATP-binding protein [Clostridia bacterium]|nr:energy-coupling factor ABC transporter ATP-binding protein [Clostridia bacterium]
MTDLIRLENVCFAYEGHVALRYIDLEIERGETVVLQGANGCGKSTLLKLINGLIFPEEGSYTFQGREISAAALKDTVTSKAFHQKIGFVFQNPDVQLFCGSVREEIEFGPRQMGLSEEEIKKRTDDVIGLLGIDYLSDRAPYHLSGGEKKKVSLACVLSMNPEVLVLDEPLAGLDRPTQDWLTGFLQQLQEAGKTLVISTHDDELAHLLGDRIVYMNMDHGIDYIL